MKIKNKEMDKKKQRKERKFRQDKATYHTSPIKNINIKLISIIAACVLIVVLIACTGFALLNLNNKKIIKGVSITGIQVSGLTKEEAEAKLNDEMTKKLEKEISFKTGEFEYTIQLNQLETNYNIKKAVDDAYSVGRNGNIFGNNFAIVKTMIKKQDVNIDYEYNEKLLNDTIDDISVKLPDAVVEPSYDVDEEESILIITRGKKGNGVNKEDLKNKLTEIVQNKSQSSEIIIEVVETEPQDIDIDKIYNEVHKEPKNAYYTKDPFQVFPHENGIDFDLEKAREILKEDKEEYEIELEIIVPEITTNKIGSEAFPDLLSTFTTKYDASKTSRTTNLILAMNKLDGTVVSPGEVFSYNQTLGKRTAEAGYQEAGGFSGGRTVQMLAGGICQISSTLYDAAVYANLDIVERHNHMFLAGYVGAGKDATVVWGSCDLKFKNTRSYPIMIKTSIGGGVATVRIFGIKEDVEYDIDISTTILSTTPFSVIYEDDYNLDEGEEVVEQYGMNGCRSVTYKIVSLNGKEISRTVLSNDTYDPMNKIIRRGVRRTEDHSEPEPATVEEPDPVEPDNTSNNNNNNNNKPSNEDKPVVDDNPKPKPPEPDPEPTEPDPEPEPPDDTPETP